MNKLPLTFDLDALRSFVTGIECGSFAQAASRLCRSTSAVSAQLKKLDFIQTLEDAVFDVHTAVVVYEQQGLTCSTKPAA